MVVTRPPMGWNSWNTFGDKIDEKLIMETADAMEREKLAEYGYEYLVVDDCWSEKVRDGRGRLVADHIKFPHGMKYVADYVHSKGLKFGMYSCAGAITCGGYPGSYEHEYIDAATFAEWGVDFLKYDYCFRNTTVPGELLYRRMGLALANCGRDILFSACSGGFDKTNEWIKTTGAHMWRSTCDICDTWGSIFGIMEQQMPFLPTNGHGCFNDMDMLVVGMNGSGNVADGSTHTFEEYKTHFSIWALFGSPLMLGCDVRSMTDETRKIITNRDVLAIDQDEAGRQVFIAKNSWKDVVVAMRILADGDLAIGMFNMGDRHTNNWAGYCTLNEMGIPISSGKTLKLRELWTGEEISLNNELFNRGGIEAHDCALFRAKIVDR